MSVTISFLTLFALLLLGVPVGFALAISGSLGLFLHSGFGAMFGILQTTPYMSVASFILVAIPMFILMAEFAANSGITERTFRASHYWLGHMPGGLAIATVFASTGLAAISGSSTAATATMAKTAVGEMRKYKYKESFAVGVVSLAGTLAVMIPPSIILIVYGILTEVPIGPLLIAGIIPGIITAIGYMISIFVWVKKWPEDAPQIEKYSLKDRVKSLSGIWPMFLLIIFMIVAIYSGAVTPTEAGAVGASACLLIGTLMVGLKVSGIKEALSQTAQTTSMIFMIIIGAMIFGYFITVTQLTQSILQYVISLPFSPYVIMSIIVIIYLLLGTFMDQLAVLFLTIPITFPISQVLGFDPIWFGIIVTKTVEIGLVTPPLGLNVFIASKAANVPVVEGFKGVSRLLIVELIILIILFCFPAISTWLPQKMAG